MPRQFAEGKNAVFICDRSGRKYLQSRMVKEPGTGHLVHWSESDGPWNVVDHPQNFPPKKLTEAIALRWARPARDEVAYDDTLIADDTGQIILFEGQQEVVSGALGVFAQVSADIAGT